MRFFIALLGLIIFHFGFAQIKISAASKYDIRDWNHDQLPLILKVNENFKISLGKRGCFFCQFQCDIGL